MSRKVLVALREHRIAVNGLERANCLGNRAVAQSNHRCSLVHQQTDLDWLRVERRAGGC